jgi:hypothetical protein
MEYIKVSNCCHSLAETPRFVAHVGDKVLARTDNGLLRELTVKVINGQNVLCSDADDRVIEISVDKIDTLWLS